MAPANSNGRSNWRRITATVPVTSATANPGPLRLTGPYQTTAPITITADQ